MRKLLVLFLLISKIGIAQVNLSLGLRAYYPFTGNANDVSGNNNNPVFNNATLTADRLGNANSAYHFNGSSSYMKIANNATINMGTQMSIALWVRPTGYYTGQCYNNMLLMKGDADYLTGNYFLRFSDVVTGCTSPTTAAEQFYAQGVVAPSPLVQLNQWYSVVYTNDGTTAKIYVNCVLQQSAPASYSFTNVYDLYIGHLNNTQYPYWLNGDLDEIRIYDRALNQDEVNVYGGCATGTTNCNNWLSTPSLPSYVNIGDLDIIGNKLTVEATINLTQPYLPGTGDGNDGDIVSKHQGPTDANYLLRPNHAYITTSNGFFATPDVCAIELNKTYHLAMVYDGTTLKYYRNGFLMSQVPATGNLIQNNFPTRLGLYTGLTLENFKGYMNEVRIWNVARTQAEIRSYMNTSLPSPTTQTGLQAYYTFDNLLNKQGNAAWNGTLGGSAAINATNPNCSFIADSCAIVVSTVTASFTAPDEVCVNTPVQVVNTSQNASNYYWSFCETSFASTPSAVNLGNPGSAAQSPVFQDLVKDDNGNYYGFLTNNFPSGLVRYNFGNSLLNTPTVDFLGNPGNKIPGNAEGIRVVKGPNGWVAIIVGGDPVGSSNTPALATITFGTSLSNPTPTASNFGNIGNMSYPIDLYVFTENNKWYGYTVNFRNNTITRFDFGTDFLAPTAINLGNIGGLTTPVGIGEIKDGDNWYMFITNETNNTLTRLSFGTSLLNTPTGVNLGNPPGSQFGKPRDISFIRLCDGIVGLAVNGDNNTITKLDFGNNILGTPVASSLGNIGNLNFPHSISRLFRENSDIYAFIPNVTSNTISRIRFSGCQNIPGSNQQTPGPITYTQTGTYNINLIVDIGLPTQASICKKIVVKDCAANIINDYTPVTAFNPCANLLTVEDATKYNAGDTVVLMQMKGAVIDSTNTAAFGTITNYKNAGNYEFNYIKSKTGNVIELKNALTNQYDIPGGKVQLIRVPYYNSYTADNTLTCLPWDGSKGGVLVLNAANAVILNANIDVSAKGFRGGKTSNVIVNTLSCTRDAFFAPGTSTDYARKGEGITDISDSKLNGRGSLANGGGGGNGHNSGGGGGSNIGKGGFGGYQLDGCGSSPHDNRGEPGVQLTNAANRLFMGGGGGAGHSDNSNPDFLSPGGNGGGIVIILAGSIQNNNHLVLANGTNGENCQLGNTCHHDGMGGGGAGGSVLIKISTYADTIRINANGGKGDDLPVYATSAGKVGPGGGGGGGAIYYNAASAPAKSITTVAGGVNGVIIPLANDPWGTTPGVAGASFFNVNVPVSTTPFKKNIDSTRFTNTLSGCRTFDFAGKAYVNTNPVATWQWTFGDGGTGNTQNVTHTYPALGSYTVTLIVTDINGCKDTTAHTILAASDVVADAGKDTSVCDPGTNVSLTLHATGGTVYAWTPAANLNDPTSANPVATINTTTTFYVTVSNAGGCSNTDSVKVTLSGQIVPTITISGNAAECKGTPVTFTATTTNGGPAPTYQWKKNNINAGTNTASYTDNGLTSGDIIKCVFTSSLRCAAPKTVESNSIAVTIYDAPASIRYPDQSALTGQPLQLQARMISGSSYEWLPPVGLNNNSISNPIYNYDLTEEYKIHITTLQGCHIIDTQLVKIGDKIGIYVPKAFSPNNNGVNDRLYPILVGIQQLYYFRVYNRWGNLIFETNSGSPSNGWNGRFKNAIQPVETYTWAAAGIDIHGNVIKKTGNTLLIR